MNSALPKVLHQLAAKSLLQHVVDTAQALSPQSITVVHGHNAQTVRSGTTSADQPLHWALQDPQRGTGHALMQALPHLPEVGVVLVLYGDVPLLQAETLRQLIALTQEGQRLALLVQKMDVPTGYGRIVRDAAGQVIAIREERDASPAEKTITEVNTGIMAIPAACLAHWLTRLSCENAQNEYYLTDVVALAVADGVPIETAMPTSHWEALGVNSKKQLAELERIHQRETAERLLEAGVTLLDPARLDVRGTLNCGRDVQIDINCVFEGKVVLGEGVRVGPHCVLRDCHIEDGTVIQAFCHLEGVHVGKGNRIGPYARMRPGAQTARDVHIGNFVEIKNSTLGDGTKVNHLSYVGDSTVGMRVNIGAGTITCNYDGVNKHRTIIEDDVFIGSDTQLVAPVTVGKGATIGAGSTIVTPAPPDQLTVSRARQVSIARWKRPLKKT
ncbi:MAG: UDP-N-acetylglucosamine diphosphorylase/glucosamine-1-phosphate N-acetyltransferase [Ferrovum sp.]|nr:UDP-N-acetylglucosamine diphosphorylase/glucosamine-1-phosphate N-acetyltransferase [Ferrovum sp.]